MIVPNDSISMMAYFCYHLSDNYVVLLDLNVNLSVIYVVLSKKKIITTSCSSFVIKELSSQHNNLTSDGKNVPIMNIYTHGGLLFPIKHSCSATSSFAYERDTKKSTLFLFDPGKKIEL